MRTITLTNDQASILSTYLLMSTNYRKGEYETWLKLSEERTVEGNAKYQHAEDNAKWWAETIAMLEAVEKAIDKAPYEEEK